MATEVELKLAASVESLEQARTHPALTAASAGAQRSVTLNSTYYDTPAGDLHRAGIGLRVRHAGDAWLQTVKGTGSEYAGLHRRPEFEWPIASPRLDRGKLATTPWASAFAVAGRHLRPVFRTQIVRIEQPLTFADGTRAIACFDRGIVRAGNKRLPICEVEIELVEGDPSHLFELALALASDVRLSIATASKAQRGYALAWSLAPQPLRATTVDLSNDMPVASALSALAGECLRQIAANAEGFAAGGGDEFLHQLRVGMRRYRSLLRLTGRVTGKEVIAPLVAELRWLGATLGPARDWDVFAIHTLSGILPHLEDPSLRKDGGRLRYRVTRMRKRLRKEAIDAVTSTRFTLLMLRAGLHLLTLQRPTGTPDAAGQSARAFAREMLTRHSASLRKRGKGLRAAPPARRHRARIAAKRLRYAAEFFMPLFTQRRARAYVKALAHLQGVLGQLNDIATAQGLVDRIAPPGAPAPHAAGMVRGWAAAAAGYEAARIDKAWKSFARLKPFWN